MKKIEFYIRFYTHPGQKLFVTGNIEQLGQDDPSGSLALEYMNEEFWRGSLGLPAFPDEPLHYHYVLQNEDGSLVEEWGNDRVLVNPGTGVDEIQTIDTWNHAGAYENVFYTSPFSNVLLKCAEHKQAKVLPKLASGASGVKEQVTHIFKVKAPLLKKDELPCLLGNGKALKDWDTSKPLLMHREGNWWVIRINIPKESFPILYKYGIYDQEQKKFIRYEDGANRLLHGDARIQKINILHDGFIRLPNDTWHGAGMAIPVFSLRSKRSFGIGEFTDLKLLADWASQTGFRLLQILPVNDTSASFTWKDSYPYAAISAFALHPIYLNLEKCAGTDYADLIKPLKKRQKELNDLPEVDYEAVLKIKLGTARELYQLQKEAFFRDPEWETFFERNRHWLEPYAAFCSLRDLNNTPDFSKWKQFSSYKESEIQAYVSPERAHYDEIGFQYFIQYHLHLQLRDAADYAHKLGIILKGDIPIGIYRYSCDAWMAPRLYHMDKQAGAPPDDFAVKGQNWGFPTYNWGEMEKDGFDWWKRRFEQMSNYFDAFRIDHILGFFRIWSIPMHAVQGLLGYFVPAIPVRREEFVDRNIWFGYDRYAKPFINDAILWEIFGADSERVKEQFLKPSNSAFFELKEAFDTQRKVEDHFAALAETASSEKEPNAKESNEKLKNGLMDLIANLILIEVPGSGEQQFHFRISMENTSSFRYLDASTQQQLKELYVNYFYYRQDDFWMKEALHKLPALKRATNMLVCGEDLGMVPRCVPEVMRLLGILSLEIQRMPKDSVHEFSKPVMAPYLSVVMPSTHDMSTIRGWWEENCAVTQKFYHEELEQWGDAPLYCEPWISKAIVLQHLRSPAIWSIFQVQDILGMSEQFRRENPNDERINIPAEANHYWRYRIHLTLEELIKEDAFNEELKGYIESAGR